MQDIVGHLFLPGDLSLEIEGAGVNCKVQIPSPSMTATDLPPSAEQATAAHLALNALFHAQLAPALVEIKMGPPALNPLAPPADPAPGNPAPPANPVPPVNPVPPPPAPMPPVSDDPFAPDPPARPAPAPQP